MEKRQKTQPERHTEKRDREDKNREMDKRKNAREMETKEIKERERKNRVSELRTKESERVCCVKSVYALFFSLSFHSLRPCPVADLQSEVLSDH